MTIKQYRTEIKWALIIIVTTWTWMAMERLCGLHDQYIADARFYTNFFIIPFIILYLLALIDKQKHDYNGRITFRQGFKTGIVLTILLTILSPFTQYVTTTIVSPHFFHNAIELVVSQGVLPENEAREFFSLGNYIRHSLFTTLLFGIFVTSFVAIITPKISGNKTK